MSYHMEPQPSGDDKIIRILAIVVGCLVIIVVALGAVYFLTRSDKGSSLSEPQYQRPSASAAATSTSATEASEGAEERSGKRPETPALPGSATPVNPAARNGEPAGNFNNVYKSGPTSDDFALIVRDAFVDYFLQSDKTSGDIQAYSPVTATNYTMKCEDKESYVHCTGGNNANVYIA